MVRAFIVVGASWLAACGNGRAPLPHERGEAQLGGEVVATVDGHPVRAADVALELRGGEVRAAAERVVTDEVLSLEAERRLGRPARIERETERALVRALIEQDVHARVRPEDVSEGEVEARVAAQAARFDVPAGRTAVHALVEVPLDAPAPRDRAARDRIAALIARLRTEADPAAAMQSAEVSADFRVEPLPETRHQGLYEAPFEDALFATDHVGLLAEPVRTSFGWHAIVVTAVSPARVTPRAEALAVVRDELVQERRAAALRTLEQRLAGGTAIVRDEAAIHRALSRTFSFDDDGSP